MALYEIDNRDAPIDWETRETEKRHLQNAKNLLMCRTGEVPYDRYRGLDSGIYELPVSLLQEELLPELDRVMTWEPEAAAAEASAELDESGALLIRAVIEIGGDRE